MPAPALSIPVRANLDQFRRAMDETTSLSRSAARKATQYFLEMNKEIAGNAASRVLTRAATDAIKFAGQIALVVGAVKLMGDAIGAARDQLKAMVEIADKAQNAGVGPAFFQQFTAESHRLQVSVEDLEGALTHAFKATQDKPPVDLAAWDTGKDRITDVERALRIYNETLARTKGQTLEGLVLFRDAQTQEQKVQAVLKAMIQLEQIGQKAAALDLGERMFGSAFVDRIREGRTSAESILATMQATARATDATFTDTQVRRAKEIDDKLREVKQTLDRELKPSWDALADKLLTIKSLWSDIIGLVARAAAAANNYGALGGSALDKKMAELKNVQTLIDARPSSGILGTGIGADAENAARIRLRDKLAAEVQSMLFANTNAYGGFGGDQVSKGTSDRPTLKTTDSGDSDRLQSSADQIEKRIAALKAEAAAIDLGTEAREKARIAAQLETVAKQANAAAGLGDNVVTAEQRKVIDEVATAYGNAAVAMEKAKVAAQIKFDKQTAFLSQEDVQIAQQLRSIYPSVADALNSVEAAGMRAANGMRELSNLGQDVNRGVVRRVRPEPSKRDECLGSISRGRRQRAQ